MKPNLITGISENVSYNCHGNIDLAVLAAIFQRTDSRNDLFRLSDKQFISLFQITPSFFLFEYGEKVKTLIDRCYYDLEPMYSDYLAIWEFAQCLQSLIFAPIHTNSSFNEFTKLYSYLNIINVNRSNLKDKAHYRNKLFQSFLFSSPYSWEFSRHIKLSKNCITYNGDNIEDILSKFFDVEKEENETDKSAMIDGINSILKTTYSYMVGEKLFMPYHPQKDIYSYYYFHPTDFIELYQNNKALFYAYLDNSVDGKATFMKRAFVYNYSLFIISSPDIVMSELDCYCKHKDRILDVLFLSNSTLPNSVIKKIKFGYIEKANEQETAYNKRLNLP